MPRYTSLITVDQLDVEFDRTHCRVVAVLDGEWSARAENNRPAGNAREHVARLLFEGAARRDRLATIDEVADVTQLIDARDPARHRAENEPIDPRPGHIPGAVNHFWQSNLGASGRFLDSDGLRAEFVRSLGTLPDEETAHYCGSGVSACHKVLAQVHAGLPEPRLYCGSWSE